MATADRLAQLDHAALDTIRSISDGSDELLQQVVALFLDSTPPLLAEIDAGLAHGEMDRLRVAAHTLKSSAANLGASGLQDIARHLEAAARSGVLGPDLPSFAALKEEYEATCRALDAVLAGRGR